MLFVGFHVLSLAYTFEWQLLLFEHRVAEGGLRFVHFEMNDYFKIQ